MCFNNNNNHKYHSLKSNDLVVHLDEYLILQKHRRSSIIIPRMNLINYFNLFD